MLGEWVWQWCVEGGCGPGRLWARDASELWAEALTEQGGRLQASGSLLWHFTASPPCSCLTQSKVEEDRDFTLGFLYSGGLL